MTVLNERYLRNLERIGNSIELFAIVVMLALTFYFQIVLHELPCPLCLLQRIGFLAVALGLLLNLRFGPQPSHYALVILSALFTAFVALRQIALHVVPGTGAYGSALFGFHLYTWVFFIAMLVIVATTLMLGINRPYQNTNHSNGHWRIMRHILFFAVTLLIISNLISVVLECGFTQCPDNPITYELLK